MNSSAFSKIWIIVILIILIGGAILAWQSWWKLREEAKLPVEVKLPLIETALAMELEKIIGEEALIRETVILFGKKIRYVDKIAPEEITREGIEKNYTDLISSELYSKWIENPEETPGRVGSSPWPDRIKISSVSKIAPEKYQVRGSLVWVTSEGAASEQKLILTMVKEKIAGIERWVIAEFISKEIGEPEKPDVEFLSPQGGEKWQIGNTYELKWTTPEIPLDILQSYENRVYFSLIREGPQGNILFLEGDIPFKQGCHSWTIPEKVPNVVTGVPENFPANMVGVPVKLTLTIIAEDPAIKKVLHPLYTIESEEFVISK